MKISTKRLIAIAMLGAMVALFAQCKKYLPKDSYEACVVRYCEIKGIDAFSCKRDGANSFYILFRIKDGRNCKFNDSGANKELFDSLRNARNDFYHVSEVRTTRDGTLSPLPTYNYLAFPEIVSIDVITINEFDGSHPAGSYITELVTLDKTWGKADPNKCGPNTNVSTTAISSSNKVYLEGLTTKLHVSKLPSDPDKAHSFTVKITTADGKTYSDTVTVVRIEYSSDDDDD